jgi:hypothetical protein
MAVTARIVRVQYKDGTTALFYVTSPDLKGLLVAEPTMDELVETVPGAIPELYVADGIDMIVTRVAPFAW